MDNESNRYRPAGGQPWPGRDSQGNSPYSADQGGQPAVDIIDSERRLPGGYGGTGKAAGQKLKRLPIVSVRKVRNRKYELWFRTFLI